MKIVVLIISFSALLNTAKTSSSDNIQNAKLPNVKMDYPSKAPKLPKQYDFTSKINDIKKPAADSNLANLLKGKPLTKINDFKIDAKQEENETTNKEQGVQNMNKILYADDAETQIKETDSDIKKIPELAKKDANFNHKNFTKKLLRNEKNKIDPVIKPKANNDAQLNPVDLPPFMIPIFKPNPNVARNQARNENIESISNVLRANIPPQESFTDALKTNYQTHDVIPNIARFTLPVQDFIPETARPISQNRQPLASVNNHTAENLNENLSPIANEIQFNIPCQKASDVLEDMPVKSEFCQKSNLDLKVKGVSTSLQEQKNIERTDMFETDDSLAIIFKPKNISLLNVYGDLLKKITLTVLVPYHISKLGTRTQE